MIIIASLLGAGLIISDSPVFGVSYPAISLDRAVQHSKVIVVARVERLDADKHLAEKFNLAFVKVRWQRQLNKDTVNLRIVIQFLDQSHQIFLRSISIEAIVV